MQVGCIKGRVVLVSKRRNRIRALIEEKDEIRLQELKERFPEVSMMTLRRDLDGLEKEGHVIRTHGGAVSVKKIAGSGEENPYDLRVVENAEAKIEIAKKALPLVERGRSLYLDSGSTIMRLAKILPDEQFSILTSGLNIALEILKRSKPSVMVLGGQVNRNTLSTTGPGAMDLLETFNIDLAFMAASGFSVDRGFTVANVYEGHLKRKVLKQAKKVILLLDSSKIDKDLPFTFADLDDINILVSEKPLPIEVETVVRGLKIHVICE